MILGFKISYTLLLVFLINFLSFGQTSAIDSLFSEARKDKYQPEEVLVIYDHILELDPYHVLALHGRGKLYYRIWENAKREDESAYQHALESFDAAIQVDDEHHPSYFSRALLYFQVEEFDLAIQDISKAIMLDINNPHYFQTRGHIFNDMGKYQLGEANFQIAIKIIRRRFYTGDKRMLLGSLYRDQAFSLTKLEKYKKAFRVINRAIDIEGTYSLLNFLYKGNIYAEMEEYEKALKLYNYILEQSDDFLLAYLHRGKIFYALDQKEKAIADWSLMLEKGLDIDLKETNVKPGF